MADEPQTTDTPDDEPYAPPASGNDPDSRKRTLKTVLGAADAAGDTDAADAIREELTAVNEELTAPGPVDDLEAAAGRRRAAAAEAGPGAATTPPQGRAAPAKAATVATSKPKS
jgi:hypothetical protein